jgi:hypothetical protein
MACRRFAGSGPGAAVTSIKRIAIALGAAVAAASLAGCAASPGSIGEQLWFDKAQGYEIHHIPPDLRVRGAIGYPRTDYRFHRHAPRFVEEP